MIVNQGFLQRINVKFREFEVYMLASRWINKIFELWGESVNWGIIYNLYTGVVGKSFFIVGMAAPMYYLSLINFPIYLYSLSLLGATIIVLSYMVVLVVTPELVKFYDNSQTYVDKMISLNEKDSLDMVSEFSILDENREKLRAGYDRHMFLYKDNDKTLVDMENDLGKNMSIRSLSISKYDLINYQGIKIRISLSVSLVLGVTLIYTPAFYYAYLVLVK